ncbi:hypothetical protein VTP01DRAFT_3808 [Rhizomucor pusillus]|uniref:uncharacterized protein n=1 Tax=Rhizomucor pusillus TaxID=4840 RepID=UPI003742EBD9
MSRGNVWGTHGPIVFELLGLYRTLCASIIVRDGLQRIMAALTKSIQLSLSSVDSRTLSITGDNAMVQLLHSPDVMPETPEAIFPQAMPYPGGNSNSKSSNRITPSAK